MPMREIKFRAWHKEKGWTERVVVYGDGSWSATYENIEGYNEDEGTVLMQYTGLKDKHGRDIYEGDILLLTLGKHRLEVRWSLLGWRFFNLATQDWQFVYAADIKRLEVLGNRYEQPELLNMEEVA